MGISTKQERGARLMEGRLNKNLDRQQVAGIICVEVNTYKKWELGDSEPRSLDLVSEVCRAVGISIDHYVDGAQCSGCERVSQELTGLLQLHEIQSTRLQKEIKTVIRHATMTDKD